MPLKYAIDKVMGWIDAHFRIKLSLAPQADLFHIERALMAPLLQERSVKMHVSPSAEEPEVPAMEVLIQQDLAAAAAFPAAAPPDTGSSKQEKKTKKSAKQDEETKQPPPQEDKTKQPQQEITEPLLNFNMTWFAFLDQNCDEFAKTMRGNLSVRPAHCRPDALTHNKTLILFRFRRNLQKINERINRLLIERDEAIKSQSAHALMPIDAQAIADIKQEILDAQGPQGLCAQARDLATVNYLPFLGLKRTPVEKDTETLLARIDLFLDEYLKFCMQVDGLTRLPLSHPYALQDVLPSTLALRGDSTAVAQKQMMEYIMLNLDEASEYSFYYLTFYSQAVAEAKRNEVKSFFKALNDAVANIRQPQRKIEALNDERDEAVLDRIDGALQACPSVTPYWTLKEQSLPEYLALTHKKIAELASDSVRFKHSTDCRVRDKLAKFK